MNNPAFLRKALRISCFLTVASILAAANTASAVPAVTVCVTTPSQLQTELDNAVNRTVQTNILIARGFYATGGTPFTFYNPDPAGAQGQLDLSGGYDSTCTATDEDPESTVLDGGNASQVLALESLGGISVRWLTIQHGNANGNAGISLESTGGGVILHYSIIRGNVASSGTGGVFAGVETAVFSTTSSGNVDVSGNLIVDNSASDDGGGNISNNGTGSIFVVNNTVTRNIVTANAVGLTGGLRVISATPGPYISNNILYGNNSNTYDLNANDGTQVLMNNVFGLRANTYDPSSSNNIYQDPKFVSTTDFHVQANSPALGAGTLTPAGGIALATVDVIGNPRTYNGVVDIGAYNNDDLFKSGFDF